MKSMIDCVSSNVYVELHTIESVIASDGLLRDSPAWTLIVDAPKRLTDVVGGLLLIVIVIHIYVNLNKKAAGPEVHITDSG